jgi:hypothetical protein
MASVASDVALGLWAVFSEIPLFEPPFQHFLTRRGQQLRTEQCFHRYIGEGFVLDKKIMIIFKNTSYPTGSIHLVQSSDVWSKVLPLLLGIDLALFMSASECGALPCTSV